MAIIARLWNELGDRASGGSNKQRKKKREIRGRGIGREGKMLRESSIRWEILRANGKNCISPRASCSDALVASRDKIIEGARLSRYESRARVRDY